MTPHGVYQLGVYSYCVLTPPVLGGVMDGYYTHTKRIFWHVYECPKRLSTRCVPLYYFAPSECFLYPIHKLHELGACARSCGVYSIYVTRASTKRIYSIKVRLLVRPRFNFRPRFCWSNFSHYISPDLMCTALPTSGTANLLLSIVHNTGQSH